MLQVAFHGAETVKFGDGCARSLVPEAANHGRQTAGQTGQPEDVQKRQAASGAEKGKNLTGALQKTVDAVRREVSELGA